MDRKRLLASDIDGTLIAPGTTDPEAVAAFRRWREGQSDLALAYVTGRSFENALETIESAGLPWPDAVASAVGTSVHWRRGDTWEPDEAYSTQLAAALGVSRLDEVDPVVLGHDGIRRQAPEEQSRFKRSFLREARPFGDDLVRGIGSALLGRGLRVNLVSSLDPWTGDGLLDVLPRDTDKARAVEHLRARISLDVDAVVFAGDSGNDVAALSRPWWSILVGNAGDEVRAHFRPGSRASENTILAREPVMRGVLEGLRRIGWMDGLPTL